MNELQNTQQPAKFNILLIGDTCIDEYQYGYVRRISPEAPVPIFNYLYSEEKPGMAYNVKGNLENHFCNVILLTTTPSRKIRVIDQKTKHHILRIDKDVFTKEPLKIEDINVDGIDAIVVSDYEKHYVTKELLCSLHNVFTGPVFIDTKKKDLSGIKAIIKVNEDEMNSLTKEPDEGTLIVTMGSVGAYYNGVRYPVNEVEVSDVCGAGDTFLAALTYWYLETKSLEKAIVMANKAAAITVQHFGTYAPKMGEYNET